MTDRERLRAALQEALDIIEAGDIIERGAFVRYAPYITGAELDALRAALGEAVRQAEVEGHDD